MRKWLLRAAIGVGLLTPLGLWAQSQTTIVNLTGNEVIEAAYGTGGPGGTGFFTTVYALRNATGFKPFVGLTGVQTYQALVTDSTLYWVGTAPTSWTITTPASPVDGEILTIATDTTLTSLVTLTANTGQSLNSTFSSQTISAKSSVEFQYSKTTTKWYELR
jgi:hypothetical protein